MCQVVGAPFRTYLSQRDDSDGSTVVCRPAVDYVEKASELLKLKAAIDWVRTRVPPLP